MGLLELHEGIPGMEQAGTKGNSVILANHVDQIRQNNEWEKDKSPSTLSHSKIF